MKHVTFAGWVHVASALILVGLLLASCAGTVVETTCPPPVHATWDVGEELATIPYEGYEDLWAWLGDVDTLNNQLRLCS